MLRMSEDKYRLVIKNVNEAIVVAQDGRLKFVNLRIKEIFGYEVDELTSRPFINFIHPDDREMVIEKHLNRLRGEMVPPVYSFKVVAKDGSTKWVEISAVVITWGGRPATLIYLNDITGQKRKEEERGRLLADLEAKNRELEAFVYTISHDLKGPLVSLNGFSLALQKGSYSQLGKEGKHYVERIQATVAHMDDLITSLLGLSRIGRVVGPIEEIDVGLLLRKVRDELAVRIEEVGAEFVVQEPLPTVCADRGRIHQVFVNLIENAVKFRSAERALRIEVGCRQESGFCRFHVADNGIGIAPQYHEQIFAPFRKLHPEIEGVGIGLALVKKIVEHHGGRVWVQSEAGKGATFYFTIQ
jgi:PAS domain S-box-containing protein